MKLINKTQRIYSILIVGVLVLWSGVFLFAIHSAIEENIDEALRSELFVQAKRLTKKSGIPVVKTPQMTISPISTIHNTAVSLSDTTIFNSVEEEVFPYRQAKMEINIAGQAYQLTMRRSMVEYDDLFEAILLMELIFVLLLLGGLYFINRNILHRLWGPFYHTLQQMRYYNIDQPKELNWSETDVDEFKELNEVLKIMVCQVKQEYQSLKQFTENASHEIQTPLSVIANKSEMLLQDDSLPPEKTKHIATIYKTVGKLSRLNRALLMLTKIENKQFAQTEDISLSRLLKTLIPNYKTLAQSKNILVETDIKPGVQVNINEELAELMLRNLLSNAIKHNVEGGRITITLISRHLTIQNTGGEVHLRPQELFERFKTGSYDHESLGLGLSIVAAIAQASAMEISYSYEKPLHCINITF